MPNFSEYLELVFSLVVADAFTAITGGI